MTQDNVEQVQQEGILVARISVPMLKRLLRAVEKQAAKDGCSPPRWVAELLAKHLNIPKDQAVPPVKPMGRPRKVLAEAS